MPRPLLTLTIRELEELSKKYKSDIEMLDSILEELEHRSTRAADHLRIALRESAAQQRAAKASASASVTKVAPSRRGRVVSTSSPVICVDFGTSSIRAAVRPFGSFEGVALKLGAAIGSEIDDASVPSAIFIDLDRKVYFGQKALELGLSSTPALLFELSPKRWMTAGSVVDLHESPVRSVDVSRRALLAGLMSHAFMALRTAASLTREELWQSEIRIAHPVWTSHAADLQNELLWVLEAALVVPPREGMAAANLKDACAADFLGPMPRVDVVEPVAAAMKLFENQRNSRQICGLIDIGAGTTDLALMISVTPDEAAHVRRRLIPLASPCSIPMAGDVIDEEVIALLVDRTKGRLGERERADLERRRRANKELLFKRRRLSRAGVEVTLDDLVRRPMIGEMCKSIARSLQDMLVEATDRASVFTHARDHSVQSIDVVFAGGGSSIPFLKDALPKRLQLSGWPPLRIDVCSASFGREDSLPASLERLAVALGGTADPANWPSTELSQGRVHGLAGIPSARAA